MFVIIAKSLTLIISSYIYFGNILRILYIWWRTTAYSSPFR